MLCSRSILLDVMFPRFVLRVVGWIKSCSQFSVEFEEGWEAILVFVRTWDQDTFRRVCVAVLSEYSGEASPYAVVLGKLLSVVGPLFQFFPLLEDHRCFATHTLSLLGVRSGRSWSSTLSSYYGYWGNVSRNVSQSLLAVWFRFWCQSSSWSDWKSLSTETGWHVNMRWDVLLCLETSHFLLWLSSLGTLSVSGPWLWSYLRQDAGPTTTVSWFFIVHGYASVFGSISDRNLSFRRTKSNGIQTYIRWQEWILDCSIW